MTDPSYTPPATIPTFFGGSIAGTINTTPHVWMADVNGLFHTSTDLKAEWKSYYDTLMSGDPSTLTFIQHLEGNAEAVFENTALNKLASATQARDREDTQREYDAIAAAMTQLGMGGKSALTTQDYLKIETTIRNNDSLLELGMQGHGINNPSLPKYNGYTNDFQHNVDNVTLYVGGGLDNNENALTDFFDDTIISHLVYPTIAQNGHLEQLNQNAASEDTLADATGALDDAGFWRVYKASDFSATPGNATNTLTAPPPNPVLVQPANTVSTLFGGFVSNAVTLNGHTWTADANGRFVTQADLATEWKGYYQAMLNGQGGGLTGVQRLEGNAEAVFENTGLAKLSASQLAIDRMDAQREFDAIVAAQALMGMDGHTAFTNASYLALEKTVQNNAALEELALQGHGLNTPPSARYNGYTNDFQNNVDSKTLYVGAGQDSGERAVTDLFDDFILTHVPFPSVAQNGQIVQLNQNGDDESTIQAAVEGINGMMFSQVLKPTDFNRPGMWAAGTEPLPGTIITVFGATIANTMVANGHVWTAGTDGLFHTTTNLNAEWKSYYQTMLVGNGASLTAIQRQEGNAEAVFENTSINKLSASLQARDREDAQREYDAIATEMSKLGLGGSPLSSQDYMAIDQGIRSDNALQELAMQGHGLNSPPLARYNGYTNDFQHNVDTTTNYIGGGLDNGENALTDFFDDVIITHLCYPDIAQNGHLEQLNQNAASEDVLAETVSATNDAMFRRVYVAADFSKTATVGPEVFISPAAQGLADGQGPTAGAGQILSFFGLPIANTMTVNGHTWTADANGTFQTTTDLTLEWYNLYQTALAGGPLNAIQHLEANAEAVFENTAITQQSEQRQAMDRADIQRELDAVAAAMTKAGMDLNTPLTTQSYLTLEHVLQNDAALEELAIQGHGLNNINLTTQLRYYGYTNDIQNWVDNHTLYIGGGLNTGEQAVNDLLDDSILSHLPFPTVMQNGEIEQLNQNGNAEDTLPAAVAALNASMFTRVYKAADFMTPGAMPPVAPKPGVATETTLYGDTIGGTIVANGHTWIADANGQFQTMTNLGIEWRSYYQTMLAGHGDTLTATQRMEGNAEAMFENSNLNTWYMGATKEAAARADVQREIDAIAESMKTDQVQYGIDPNAPLTEASYLQLEHTLQGNVALQELAIQGHGVIGATALRWRGAYSDFVSTMDWTTNWVGGGFQNGKAALPYFFQDSVLSDLPFPTVWQNGQWTQLGLNGDAVATLQQAAAALNETMYRRVYVASDFSQNAAAVGAVVLIPGAPAAGAATIASMTAPAGMVVTMTGALIANSMTVNGHTWTAGSNGQFHTTTDLAAEWKSYYQAMLAGQGASLTATQRMEGNAEAVFEATGLSSLIAVAQKAYREDVQKQIDATAGAMLINQQTLGIDPQMALLQGSYLALERTMQSNNALEELAVQGHGVNSPVQVRYRGYVNEFANASQMKFIGGGVNNGLSALGVFMGDNIMSQTPFAVIWRNGKLVQLNQSGAVEMTLANAVAAIDDTLYNRTYKSTDFHA